LPETVTTKLEFLQGYSFKVDFGTKNIQSLVVDESTPVGEGSGPNPTQLLSASVGHCLSSSLIYCLRKARITLKGLNTTVKANVERNEEGRLRVKNIDTQIRLDIDEKDKTHIARCLEVFENYCTVTQSVRKGLSISVRVKEVAMTESRGSP